MTKTSKYRKKPVVVEVMKFGISARSQRLCKEFIGRDWVNEVPRVSPLEEIKPGIKTLEGIMAIDVGDYIIKGVQGEFYPCKPDIFADTYEEVIDDDNSDIYRK